MLIILIVQGGMQSETKMLQAEEVARAKVTSIKQEAENDTRTIEDPPNPRRVSMTRTSGLPPQAPKFQVPDLHETHGPILPVERKHQFPKDTPTRAESTSKDDFKFPVMVQEGGHQFAVVPKSGEKIEKLTGPVLEVSHSHSFKAAEAQKFDYKTLNSPAFTVGVEAGHKFNVIESAQKPVDPVVPGEQKFPIMNVSHDSKFTGPTTSVKSCNTEVKDLQYPTLINKRKFNTEKSGHSYAADLIQGQEAKVTTELQGPLYSVDAVHAFKGIMTHAHQLTEISGPVYGVEERQHHFSELGKHAETLKNLTLPVYEIDKTHHFEVIMKEAEKMMQVTGPVMPCDHASKYRPESKKIEKEQMMTKGARRHIRSSVAKIKDLMKEERVSRTLKQTDICKEIETDHLLPPRPGPRKRRSGPFRIVEVCTWTCMLTIVAAGMGWDGWEPVTLPRFDLLTCSGRNAARHYMSQLDPDFIPLAPRCTEWCQFQNINQRTPMQVRRLRQRRREQLVLLGFIDEVAQWQHRRGRGGDPPAWMIENPLRSLAWVQAPLVATAAMQDVGTVITDACVWGKRRPDTGVLIKKPTKLIGTPTVMDSVNARCPGDHEHAPIEGGCTTSSMGAGSRFRSPTGPADTQKTFVVL